MSRRLRSTAAGYVLDRFLGEPPEALHPLRAFGGLVARLERGLFRDRRLPGVLYAACGLGTGLATGAVLPWTTGATFLASGGRALGKAAETVGRSLDSGDLSMARRDIRALVGRDPEELDATELARATVESVAENTVDAIVGPMLYAAIGGAPGALGYRAANTLDSLVGYRSPHYLRFGWASARLDDVLSYAPARLTALLVGLVRPRRAAEVWRVVRRDAGAHPSPNAGVAESAFAAALGLRLGGTSSYGGVTEMRPFLGEGSPPTANDIARAVRLANHVGLAAAALAVAQRPSSDVGAPSRPGGVDEPPIRTGALPPAAGGPRRRRDGAR